MRNVVLALVIALAGCFSSGAAALNDGGQPDGGVEMVDLTIFISLDTSAFEELGGYLLTLDGNEVAADGVSPRVFTERRRVAKAEQYPPSDVVLRYRPREGEGREIEQALPAATCQRGNTVDEANRGLLIVELRYLISAEEDDDSWRLTQTCGRCDYEEGIPPTSWCH